MSCVNKWRQERSKQYCELRVDEDEKLVEGSTALMKRRGVIEHAHRSKREVWKECAATSQTVSYAPISFQVAVMRRVVSLHILL